MDPIEYVRKFREPRIIEIVGWLATFLEGPFKKGSSILGKSGKSRIGLNAGIFIAELSASGLTGEMLLFAHP